MTHLRLNGILLLGMGVSLVWAVCLFPSETPLNITAMAVIKSTGINHTVLACTVLGSFLLALYALCAKEHLNELGRFLFFFPQTALMFSAALSAAICMQRGAFADGVIRSSYFITSDQPVFIIIAVLHTAALLQFSLEG